jgi:uncharacterized integral membrane protein
MADTSPAPGARRNIEPRTVAAAVVILLVLAFVIQNGEKRTIEFLWFDIDVGLWIALTVTFLLGAAVGWLLRRGRHERLGH